MESLNKRTRKWNDPEVWRTRLRTPFPRRLIACYRGARGTRAATCCSGQAGRVFDAGNAVTMEGVRSHDCIFGVSGVSTDAAFNLSFLPRRAFFVKHICGECVRPRPAHHQCSSCLSTSFERITGVHAGICHLCYYHSPWPRRTCYGCSYFQQPFMPDRGECRSLCHRAPTHQACPGPPISFYCIIMLSALFMSSCYWPPVPLESNLSTPWTDNITTYADALASMLPNLPEDMKPKDVPMLDRCWCDLSDTGFFEQFNVTDWERRSILSLKERLEVRLKEREGETPVESEPEPQPEAGLKGTSSRDSNVASATPHEGSTANSTDVSPSKLSGLWNRVSAWPFSRKPRPSDAPSADTTPTSESRSRWTILKKDEYTPRVRRVPDPVVIETHTRTIRSSPTGLLRKEYDLRPYGFDVILDFNWEKSRAES